MEVDPSDGASDRHAKEERVPISLRVIDGTAALSADTPLDDGSIAVPREETPRT